jgi:hypothetical protein
MRKKKTCVGSRRAAYNTSYLESKLTALYVASPGYCI